MHVAVSVDCVHVAVCTCTCARLTASFCSGIQQDLLRMIHLAFSCGSSTGNAT